MSRLAENRRLTLRMLRTGRPRRPGPVTPHLGRLLDDFLATIEAHAPPAPPPRALPPPHLYALDVLAEATRESGGHFTEAEAADALDAARVLLSLPDAPPYDRTGWPDPADVGAFLRMLEADEYARADGRGGYVLDTEARPF